MTGIVQALAAAGTNVQTPVVTLLDTKAGAQANASIAFFSDGSITVSGSGSSCVPLAWYLPILAGVGASYWVKCHGNSGTAPNNNDVVQALSPGPVSFALTRASLGSSTGNWTVTLYTNAAGTAFAGSFTFNITATWN